MGKGAKKHRKRAARPPVEPVVTVPRAVLVEPATGKRAKPAKVEKAEKPGKPGKAAKAGGRPPTNLAAYAHAAALTGAKKIKKKCCRSTPRCKGCPVVLMRAARLQEAGVTGKDLKKAVKRARAA